MVVKKIISEYYFRLLQVQRIIMLKKEKKKNTASLTHTLRAEIIYSCSPRVNGNSASLKQGFPPGWSRIDTCSLSNLITPSILGLLSLFLVALSFLPGIFFFFYFSVNVMFSVNFIMSPQNLKISG